MLADASPLLRFLVVAGRLDDRQPIDAVVTARDEAVEARRDYGCARFFAGVDALILGRHTYDTALGFPAWPYGEKRCVVFTHAPPAARHGERFHSGPPGALLAALHAAGVRRAYVDGGALIRSFLRDDLIDDLTLSIVPVLLGDGIRLFDASVPARRLRLTASQRFASGLVQLRYDLERPESA